MIIHPCVAVMIQSCMSDDISLYQWLQQDNDPKHTSNLVLDYLESEDTNYWRTPSESPHLNPIEMLAEMKYFLRKNIKPLTQDQLVTRIKSFWDTVCTAKCNRYINHINKVANSYWKRWHWLATVCVFGYRNGT